jgi:hypothetical protein
MSSVSLKNTSEQSPESRFCEEKHRLTLEFTAAVQELIDLQNRQTAAVIAGDPDFSRFDVLIHIARERKDQVKYALLSHVEAGSHLLP